MLTEEDLLFGKIALDMNLLAPSQLDRVKEEMLANPQLRIGELLIQKGYLYPWDLEEILAEQARRKKQHQAEQAPGVLVKISAPQPPPRSVFAPSPPVSAEPPKLGPAPSLKITPPPPPLSSKSAAPETPVPSVKGRMGTSTTKITVTPIMPSQIAAKTPVVTPTPIPASPPVESTASQPMMVGARAAEENYEPTAPLVPIPVEGRLRELLEQARSMQASDLHLSVGSPPFVRKFKNILMLPHPALTPEDTETLIFQAISEAQKKYLFKNKSLDFCLTIPGVGRYRTCFYKQINGWEAAFRVIPNAVKSFDDLKLPPVLKRLTEYPQGLILVTGPAGSGKTSTLAAMIDLINQTREDHIITIEDPVEYLQLPKRCQVSQRELRTHTKSFASALKAALRQDPDIIMIGEMRDRETMSLAISASETGHLVLGTMPTSSASRTINAVIDYFPPDQQGQIRSMISESLRGIVCQNLIPNVQGTGVELALEVLLFDPSVATVVRNNQLHQLASVMQTGKARGMKSLDDSLVSLVHQGSIDPEEAYALAENKPIFEQYRKKK